jgi:hypothetical protein
MSASRTPPAGLLVGSLLGLLALASPRQARAEASSWLSVSGGAASTQTDSHSSAWRFALPFNLGVGTTPSQALILGLGFRMTPLFQEGVDFGAYIRGANQGYVVGGFGLALDVGTYVHKFGDGSAGLYAAANLGIPWGGVVTVLFERGGSNFQSVGATVGIDFLRLTVYRLAGRQEWPNVRPAWSPDTPSPPPATPGP